MAKAEKTIEKIAAELIMVEADDLPALASIHEDFIQLKGCKGIKSTLALEGIKACADLVEKIVLSDVDDKAEALKILNDSIVTLQALIRDNRDESEVTFPAELGINAETGIKGDQSPIEKTSIDSNEAKTEEDDDIDEDSYLIELGDADAELTADFINEAREHCTTAEQMLMDLETGDDKDDKINAIFRSFHTIKGAAGFLDLKPIMTVSHECETLLDLGRKGTVSIEGSIADIVFDSIDTLRQLLQGTEEALSTGSPFDGRAAVSSVLLTLRNILKNPSDAPPEATGDRIGDRLIDSGIVSQSQIDAAIENRENPNEKLGETLVKQNIVPAKAVAQVLRQQQRSKQDKVVGSTAVKEMVKIDTERLDRMIDTIGELVIAESMVGQDEEIISQVSQKVIRNIGHLNKITRELQEMGMSMRLLPVKGTFQKLARAVRDMTRKSGKKVDLQLFGEDTEVDRSIIELIGDPLMHMIRNAMDHGVEKPSDRTAVGKPETGTVTLKAYHKGGKVYFDIEDDGKGLDKDKILAKAIEKKLIEPGKELTEQEIFKMIFQPGFSTAAKITDISGRGVGMDVVKKNIDAMRGHLDIESELGKGTKFSMKLPLTLAIIEGMLVSIADEKFIIPTLSVVESLSLTPDMITTIAGRDELINLRGEMLPLLRIRRIFGLSSGEIDNSENTVVVVEDGVSRLGIVVDKLLGQRQTVIKSLGSTFSEQKWISGGAILSDGNIGLIIDVGGVIGLSEMVADELFQNQHTANRVNRKSVDLSEEAALEKPELAKIQEANGENEEKFLADEIETELIDA